jgi:hypothetical protein
MPLCVPSPDRARLTTHLHSEDLPFPAHTPLLNLLCEVHEGNNRLHYPPVLCMDSVVMRTEVLL